MKEHITLFDLHNRQSFPTKKTEEKHFNHWILYRQCSVTTRSTLWHIVSRIMVLLQVDLMEGHSHQSSANHQQMLRGSYKWISCNLIALMRMKGFVWLKNICQCFGWVISLDANAHFFVVVKRAKTRMECICSTNAMRRKQCCQGHSSDHSSSESSHIMTLMILGHVGTPFEWGPCPATVGDHLSEFRSNMGCWWRPDDDTRHPNPLQSSSWWCTSWSTRTRPQIRGWQIDSEVLQTPGYWRSSNYSQVGSCRQLLGGSHGDNYSSCFEQICCYRSDIPQTPHHQHSTGAHLKNVIVIWKNIIEWA